MRAVLVCVLLSGCASDAEVVSCDCAVEFNSKSPTGAQGIFNSSLVVDSCTNDPPDPTTEATAAAATCVTVENTADTFYAHVCACNCVHLVEACKTD
jgi:hypothetical protein